MQHLPPPPRLAASSRHPYSRAIIAAAAARGLAVQAVEGVSEVAGMGLWRQTPAGEERLGSAIWCDVSASAGSDHGLWYRPAEGAPIVLQFADQLREDASEVIARLKAGGYRVELLSGDAPAPVAAMAKAAGIEVYHAEVRPDGKIARLEELKRQGRKVLMVGDGLNDAPALAAAHASLSPAAAPEISQTAADAVFQGSQAGAAHRVSRRRPRRPPHVAAEFRARGGLQHRVRSTGDGRPGDPADRRGRHVDVIDHRHRQCRAAALGQTGGQGMTALAWLIPSALALGVLGLAAFLWSLKSRQFEDLEGAGWRALDDDQPSR